MNWSIVIFAFNEGDSLAATIGRCVEFLSEHAKAYEMILVDDGSTDNTQEVCERLKREHPALRVLRQPKNLGIGHTLRTGYEAAQYEYVCAIPGDGQFDPSELATIPAFGPMEFYSFYRSNQSYNLYRQMLSNINRWLNRLFLGLNMKDVNWVKVYRLEQLKLAAPKLTSSVIESEICWRLVKAGIRPIGLPSIYHPRLNGEAKGGRWNTVAQVLSDMPPLYFGSLPRE